MTCNTNSCLFRLSNSKNEIKLIGILQLFSHVCWNELYLIRISSKQVSFEILDRSLFDVQLNFKVIGLLLKNAAPNILKSIDSALISNIIKSWMLFKKDGNFDWFLVPRFNENYVVILDIFTIICFYHYIILTLQLFNKTRTLIHFFLNSFVLNCLIDFW